VDAAREDGAMTTRQIHHYDGPWACLRPVPVPEREGPKTDGPTITTLNMRGGILHLATDPWAYARYIANSKGYLADSEWEASMWAPSGAKP
jgi:hypothetical protein